MFKRVIDPYEESLETPLESYFAIKIVLKNTSNVIVQLNELFPMDNFRHLKRIRKIKDDHFVTALVCKLNEIEHEKELSSKLKEFEIPFEEILIISVPIRRAITKIQYDTWNSIWPCVFHESMDEKLKTRQLNEHSKLYSSFQSYFMENKLSILIVEATETTTGFAEDLIIHESSCETITCNESGNSYPFDHFVLKCLNGPLKNKRVTRITGKVPYLLFGCVAILSHEPCVMCSMALLHSRIDAVIYLEKNEASGALGSTCFLHANDSLNHHFPVYQVEGTCPCKMSDKKKFGNANDKPRIVSLRDLKDGNNCSSDEDEKQTYYAGGEKSGTAIQGGGKKGNDFKAAQDIMSGIFAKATSEDPSKSMKSNFKSGVGRKFNDKSNTSATASSATKPEIVTVDLIFWSDGFTVGQGPLQSYTEPEGLRLLDRIKNGTVTADDLGIEAFEMADVRISQFPSEPFSSKRRSQIMKDPTASSDQTTPLSPQQPTFSGTGEKLGADESTEDSIVINESAQLDPSISSTRIQIVLPTGARKVITISARAKVSELYSQVSKETNLKNFKLKLGNPPKSIPEALDAELYQIGLLNASIILTPINN